MVVCTSFLFPVLPFAGRVAGNRLEYKVMNYACESICSHFVDEVACSLFECFGGQVSENFSCFFFVAAIVFSSAILKSRYRLECRNIHVSFLSSISCMGLLRITAIFIVIASPTLYICTCTCSYASILIVLARKLPHTFPFSVRGHFKDRQASLFCASFFFDFVPSM